MSLYCPITLQKTKKQKKTFQHYHGDRYYQMILKIHLRALSLFIVPLTKTLPLLHSSHKTSKNFYRTPVDEKPQHITLHFRLLLEKKTAIFIAPIRLSDTVTHVRRNPLQ